MDTDIVANAGPLDTSAARDALVGTLLLATSTSAHELGLANAQLESWERDPAFWEVLLEIAFDRSLQLGELGAGSDEAARRTSVRTIAIIRFKNGVDKYWRTRVVSRVAVSISKEAKERLRALLFRCLDEPDRTIALQASVAITRIARYDYPTAWPDLFTKLQRAMVEAHAALEALGNGSDAQTAEARYRSTLILMRAADVCARTLKELETVRVLAGKIRMTELARNLLPVLEPIFLQYFSEIFSPVAASSDPSALRTWADFSLRAEQVRTSHLLLKALTRLAVADMGMVSRGAAAGGLAANLAQGFFRATPPLLQALTYVRSQYVSALRATGSNPGPREAALTAALSKHLFAFGKLYLALGGRENGKAAEWSGWADVVWWYWVQARDANAESFSGSDNGNAATLLVHPPKFIIQALLLLKRSIQEWRGDASLLTPSFVRELTDALVGRFMRLSPADLENWHMDPEDWAVGEEGEGFDLDIRPCAERVLMVLAQHAKPARSVGEYLWQRFEATAQLGNELDDVLARDAIYTAVGRCRDYLPDEVDFSDVTIRRMVPEASTEGAHGANWIIVRRRIAWLLWEWSEQLSPAAHGPVYALLVSLLEDVAGTTDVAVRLAAARCLAGLADALAFDADAFTPYLPLAVARLATLATASGLHEIESVKSCTDALAVIIERVGPRVAPFATPLATLVLGLWQTEDPDCKARPSLLVLVTKLVRAVADAKDLDPQVLAQIVQQLHQLVEILVRGSFQPDVAPLLGKDALLLWAKALHSAPQMTGPLFAILDLVPSLLDQPDYTPEVCRIVENAALLAPREMLQQHGMSLFQAFATIAADATNPLILAPIGALDRILQALGAAGAPGELWPQLMQSSGLFTVLLGSVLHVEESAVIAGYFVALFARMAYNAPAGAFSSLIHNSAAQLGHGDVGGSVWTPLVRTWCRRFENMSSARRRKMTALGLASLLRAAGPADVAILQALPEMVAVWSEALGEIRENEQGDSNQYHRAPSPAPSMGGMAALSDDGDWLEDTSPGASRLSALADGDPIVTVRLAPFVSEALNEAQARHGSAFEQAIGSMDPLVLEMLQRDLSN